MSESLRSQWPSTSAPFEEHVAFLNRGARIIEEEMIVANDQRVQTVYTQLSVGRGQDSSVAARAPGGTGKTTLGDLMMGHESRVEVTADDTESTFFGYESPTEKRTVPGKMTATPDNPDFHLSEFPQLYNKGPIHRLWDKQFVMMNGLMVPMEHAAIYMTGNYADGERNSEDDEAFAKRQGAELLMGDLGSASAAILQGVMADRGHSWELAPILPTADVRAYLNAEVAKLFPIAANLGTFIVEVVNEINNTGLFMDIEDGDGRLGRSLLNTARAKMLRNSQLGVVDLAKWMPIAKRAITPADIAEVAALNFPTIAKFTQTAQKKLMEEGGRRPTNLEMAIAKRRAIARSAFTAYGRFERLERPSEFIAASVETFSYGNVEAIGLDVDKAFLSKPVTDKERAQEGGRVKRAKRYFGFDSARAEN
ncbi:MAG TPA: hypothetical protein VIH90_03865 [Candidatus Saccharimonadales bacterium]